MTTDTYDNSLTWRENFLVAIKQRIKGLRDDLYWSADTMADYYEGDLDTGGNYIYDQYYGETKRDAKRALKELTFWAAILEELTKEEES